MKSGRWVGRRLGKVIDAEDRRLLAQASVLVFGGGGIVVAGAAAIGLAVRVYGLMAGDPASWPW